MIKRAIFLLYKYYSGSGTKDIPYESALLSCAFFILVHVFQIKLLLFGGTLLFGESKIKRLGFAFVLVIVVYFILNLVFKRTDIKNMVYPESDIRRDSFYLLAYTIGNCLLLAIIIITTRN
jgi:hypothetical protein